MAVRNILKLGNPLLREKCQPVRLPLSGEDRKQLNDLLDTLHDFQQRNGFGRAIAAPQIGWLAAVVCVDTGRPRYFLNPVITTYSEAKMELFDDCFSLPGIMVRIERAQEIVVEYYTVDGCLRREKFHDDMAELLQHEIDHLHGILAIDRAKSVRDIWSREEWLRVYGKK